MSQKSDLFDLAAFQTSLRDVKPTQAGALRAALPDILAARARGVPYQVICELLGKNGLQIRPQALAKFVYRAKSRATAVSPSRRATPPPSPAPPQFQFDPSRAHQMLKRTTKES